MINCPDCSEFIDGQVPACPQCGGRIDVEHPADMNVKHKPLDPLPKSLPQQLIRLLFPAQRFN